MCPDRSSTGPIRRDYTIESRDGTTIAVRTVQPPDGASKDGTPILLLHGTRPDGISEYDLPVEGGSIAAELAGAGHSSIIPDMRGYGRSPRPACMERPPEESQPFARCIEVTRDIDAAVDELRKVTGAERVALMGWGVGATAVLMHAAMEPEKISHVVLLNPLYGGGGSHPRYRDHPLEDPDHPSRFNAAHYGGYSFNDPDMLMKKWASSIPVEDKDSWRDPEVAEAFAQALLDGDSTSRDRTPPSYRSPNGMLEDSYFMGRGMPLLHASQVYSRVLIIRPKLDYFSRPEDIDALRGDLVNAPEVRSWEPEKVTHFVFMDRPERGRADAIAQLLNFLGT